MLEIKSTHAVPIQKRLKSLVPLGFGKSPPFELLDRNLDFVDHVLHGHLESFPAQTAAQNRMSIGYPLPSAKELYFVQRLVQRGDHLLDVNAGSPFAHGMEEHARLHRRELVGIDDTGHDTAAKQSERDTETI